MQSNVSHVISTIHVNIMHVYIIVYYVCLYIYIHIYNKKKGKKCAGERIHIYIFFQIHLELFYTHLLYTKTSQWSQVPLFST